VTGPVPRRVEIAAPAKLNLGLEIIGRRPDGYHDLATIFLTVNLCDRVVVGEDGEAARRRDGESRSRGVEESRSGDEPTYLPSRWEDGGREPPVTFTCSDPALGTDDNLALQALLVLRRETGTVRAAHLILEKRIPTASGLGGASSDAAAALIAGNALWSLGLGHDRLGELAAGLGSDVPFLLRGGCALGRGRGDLLEPLPLPLDVCFVLVMPRVVIPRKTARLYALLEATDSSDGSRVSAQAERLRAGHPLDPTLLGNAFARPLADLVPELAGLGDVLRTAGAPSVALSGAGPTHYVPLTDRREAERLATAIRERIGSRADVAVVEPVLPRLHASGCG
jgi:4-diphosphocytidyl-2-C-methyl-D-erythritol kinase